MLSPKEFIESIRRKRFGIGLNDIDAEARGVIDEQQKIIQGMLYQLSTDLYAKETHFVLELIQNAEDNNYDSQVRPFLRFIIDNEKILVQNNELGFSEDNVSALCSANQSTKQKKDGYIGEKGIGFKSVFRICNNPRLFSNDFYFEFKCDDKQNHYGYIVPYWIDKIPPFIDPALTNIVLPLREEMKGELFKFNEIDPTLLLFLHKLKTIEIQNSGGAANRITRHDKDDSTEIRHSKGKDFWKMVRVSLTVPPHIHEEKREEVHETEVTLAFPLKQNREANATLQPPVFAFLPTRPYGFKFIIQADFLVTTNREGIHENKAWNQWIRDEIANAFLQAVEEFKKDKKLKKTFYNFIPLEREVEEFFSPVVSQMHNALRQTNCILTASQQWRKPEEVFRADKAIRELVSKEDIKAFFKKEYISPDLTVVRDILDVLKVPKFEFKDLVACIRNTEWLSKQSDEWFVKLYAYLHTYLSTLQHARIQELKPLKLVRLMNNELTSIQERPIFSPLDKKSDYGFEDDLRIIKRSIYEPKRKEMIGPVQELLKKLGVSKSDPYEIIEKQILPLYESGDKASNWQIKSNHTLIGHVRYIKDHLQEYESEKRRLNPSGSDPLQKIIDNLWIRFDHPDLTIRHHSHAMYLYLGKAYGNDNDLEKLFEGIADIKFIHEQYVQDSIARIRKGVGKQNEDNLKKRIEKEKSEWRRFFRRLGVEEKIRVHEILEPSRPSYANYKSDDLESIIKTGDVDRISQALKILERNWDEYSRFLKAGYSFHRVEKSRFHSLLTDSKWIPTKRKTLEKPNHVFIDDPKIKDILGASGIYLGVRIKNTDFLNSIGVHTEFNIESVLDHLKLMVESESKDKEVYRKLYDFLSRRFESDPDQISQGFSDEPLIFIPGNHRNHFTSSDVLWEDASEICGDDRGYLSRHYPKQLKTFFVEKLQVDEKPQPKDYADFLRRLPEKSTITKAEEELILKVYDELNEHLKPDSDVDLISNQDWWDSFISESIFWTDKEEFRTNDDNVFIDDDENIRELFGSHPEIAFLKIPDNYHPKIQCFLETARIPCVSKVVERYIVHDEEPILDTELSKRVRGFAPYVWRYLYQKNYELYKSLKQSGQLGQLSEFNCYQVKKLQVKYILNQENEMAEQKAFLHEGELYVQEDYRDDTEDMAVALARFLKDPNGLSGFLIALFDRRTPNKIEKALKAQKIGELPDQELFEIESGKREEANIQEEDSEQETDGYDESIEYLDQDSKNEHEEGTIESGDSLEESLVLQKVSQPEESQPIPSKRHLTPPETKGQRETTTDETRSLSIAQDLAPSGKSTETNLIEPKIVSADSVDDDQNIEWQPECKPEDVAVHFEESDFANNKPGQTNRSQTTRQGTSRSDSPPADKLGEMQDLSPKTKKEIGWWGEGYVVHCLRDRFSKKYPKASIQDTDYGFIVLQNGRTLVDVRWYNKNTDTGIGYDILVIEKGEDEEGKESFIEVKSTKTEDKEWFDISSAQWKCAHEHQENYFIYRVTNTGTKRVKVKEIRNPFKLWKEGKIASDSIRIQI